MNLVNIPPRDKSRAVTPVFESSRLKQSPTYHPENFLVQFVAIPLRVSYVLGISPFYLKQKRNQAAQHLVQEFEVATWLPQKIICAVLTLLNLEIMLGTLMRFLPKHHKNPAQHIMFLVVFNSSLYKCWMFKTLWRNQSEFAELANFICGSQLPLLKQWKWLPFKVLIILVMGFNIFMSIGFMNLFHGKVADAQPNLMEWWQKNIQNFLLESASNTTRENSYHGNLVIGICGVIAYVYRYF